MMEMDTDEHAQINTKFLRGAYDITNLEANVLLTDKGYGNPI